MKIAQRNRNPRITMTQFALGVGAAMVFLGVAPARATLLTVFDYTFENNATPVGFSEIGSPSYSGGQLVLDGSSCLSQASPVTDTDNFGICLLYTSDAAANREV